MQLARDLCLFRVLPVIKQASVYYAAIRSELKASGFPIPANDAWIAALARQNHATLVLTFEHKAMHYLAKKIGNVCP